MINALDRRDRHDRAGTEHQRDLEPANSNTAGFKKARVDFAILYQTMR
jgi:hypothetical protein